MATLHMDTDSCRNMASTLLNVKSTLDEQVASLGNTVNSVVGSAWIAPSANEFQSAYTEWANAIRQMTGQLEALQQRLNAEIAEFESAGSRFA